MSDTYLSNEGHFVPRKVEKWIPPIDGRFKLNFDGSRINNISASGWVIRNSNGTIKIARSRHLGNASTIIAECVALRDDVLAAIYNGFTNLEIEGDSKVIIVCYNRRSNSLSSIILLMEDIWRLSQDLNIYNCGHIYREANRTTNCLAKKSSYNTNPNIGAQIFLGTL